MSKSCYIVGPDLRAGSINSRYKRFLQSGGGGCVSADIFTECFSGATPGSITMGAPGPLNGWTFRSPFGPKGGTVTFSPGVMTFDCSTGTSPGASKAHPALASVSNITMQVDFTEFPAPVVPQRRYDFVVTNTGFTQMVYVSLDENGFFGITIGDPNSLDGWSGVWTPTSGSHRLHVTVDALNVPRAWLDGVEIMLNFDGTGFSGPGALPSDTVAAFFVYITDPIQGSMESFYVTSGVLPPSTVFCCL